MFSWFKRKRSEKQDLPLPPPPPAPTAPKLPDAPQTLNGNPGKGAQINIGFANGSRSWSESADLVQLLARLLAQKGYGLKAYADAVKLSDSGLILQPLIAEFQPLEPSGVRTTTTIQISHPAMFPAGVFEYQHSTGKTTEDSIHKGFEQWMLGDLPVFVDALLPKPTKCMVMEMQLPVTASRPARNRRILLGPVSFVRQHEPPPEAEAPDGEVHPGFCQCCLLTNTFEAFKSVVESDAFVGVRLFAMRGEDGQPSADCRVNGEDWNAGMDALRAYVNKWPQASFEFRKQYVIVQNSVNPPVKLPPPSQQGNA